MRSGAYMKKTVDIQKALAEPTRMMIVRLLMERELCVCELMRAIEVPQCKISKHVTVLKQAGILTDWREGTWIHYEISNDLSPEWQSVLKSLKSVWDSEKDIQAALWRLQQKVNREPGGAVVSCECGV